MCDEWLNSLQVIGTVVAAVAAVWALKQARDTVRETRAMRREERLARLPQLVTDVAEMARRVRDHHSSPSDLRIAQARLRTAIAASGERLPRSSALTEFEVVNPFDTDALVADVEAALNEVTERLQQVG